MEKFPPIKGLPADWRFVWRALVLAGLGIQSSNSAAQAAALPHYFDCHATITQSSEAVGQASDYTFRIMGQELTVYRPGSGFVSACNAAYRTPEDRCQVFVTSDFYAVSFDGVRSNGDPRWTRLRIDRVSGVYFLDTSYGFAMRGQCTPSQDPVARARKI